LKETLLRQTIIEALNTSYGIQVGMLTLVAGGADLDATTYKAESGNRSYFAKVKRGALNPIFPAILELLNTSGIQQVIAPMKTIQGHTVQQVEDSHLMVFPFMDGKNGFDCELTHFQWVTLGETLKKIHSIMISPETRELIRREDYSPQWRNTVRSLYSQIAGKVISGEIASKMVQFLIDHKATILKLVEQAEQLGQEVQKQSPPSVLCHSDIHAGNVMISETGEIYLVDWDSPILAPKERDLMFIGGGVAGVWNRPFEEELFYQGYGPTNVNSTALAYYRYERIITDIVEYTQELVFGNSENPAKESMYRHFTNIFEPGNVLEIAFKTEHNLSL
jgi:spectinomycin phosphotransferase